MELDRSEERDLPPMKPSGTYGGRFLSLAEVKAVEAAAASDAKRRRDGEVVRVLRALLDAIATQAEVPASIMADARDALRRYEDG